MAERKTTLTKASVDDFIDSHDNEQVRDDCRTLVALMQKATRAKPEMWGTSIVGFGRFQYRKKGDEWMQLGFAPRSGKLTLYLWAMWEEKKLLEELGSPKCGMGCMYLKRLSDVDQRGLAKLMRACAKRARAFKPR